MAYYTCTYVLHLLTQCFWVVIIISLLYYTVFVLTNIILCVLMNNHRYPISFKRSRTKSFCMFNLNWWGTKEDLNSLFNGNHLFSWRIFVLMINFALVCCLGSNRSVIARNALIVIKDMYTNVCHIVMRVVGVFSKFSAFINGWGCTWIEDRYCNIKSQ